MQTPGFTLAPRDPFADAKETLSSWDKCMAKDYCKWPVIAVIILGGLVAFSVVFCIARCICCGAECALCCCKCCTCCCGRSDSGHRRMKSENQAYPPPQPYPQQPYANAPANPYAEARSFAPPPPPPQISTQYQSHPTPSFNPQTNPKFASAAARPASPERPQYATFDARSRPVNEDALPAMPSWSNARSVQVQVEDEAVPERRGDVEMDRLHYTNSPPNTSTAGVAAGAAGGGMRASPGPGRSPVSPLHSTDAYNHQNYYQDQNQNHYQDQNQIQYQDQNQIQYQDQTQNHIQSHNQNTSPAYAQHDYNRAPSPAHSHSQYSQASDPYDRRSPVQPQPYSQPYSQPYNAPSDRFPSPAPPSYHTTAPNPYAYAPAPVQPFDQPRSFTPGSGRAGGNVAYDPVPDRSQTATPSAYPGQQTYQAFQPQGQPQPGSYTGVARKPVDGSLRDV
ncbi:hypothetical protein ST47_g9948 [Ascochyta rabiei]|uniref:Uncharacterized protein n=1 Tax=Didymella rabiei TaxID=5454 RepID=A0A162WAU9_DIDRA|nr:hypothetical protein ST47_g9948 [Ascochyta rabiei]